MISQKFNLIVLIIKQYARTQLLSLNQLIRQLVSLCISIFTKRYNLNLVVYGRMYDITVAEFNAFYCIILICLVIRPTTSVWTYHISSMTQWPEFKWVWFWLHRLLVAKTQRQPITLRLFYWKTKSFLANFVHPRLHQCKFVSLRRHCLHFLLWYQFDIVVFVFLWEFVTCLPYITVLHEQTHRCL